MKKFLSLVLALVMTMSLVTISAGAKDFTDADKVNYDEAIAVLSAVKVIDGYTDGSFKPQTPLNRGQAAKIICNLVLGPTTAAELSATVAPFSDVPANNIFAGYITYCANEGIICGYGDGTFRPTASLTGYAFLKMLLGALGYDAEIEGYNNPGSFGIQVAKQAIGIGLNKGLKDTFDGNKTVTREEACLYALNTLKATMVEYDQKIVANVNGAQITVGTSLANEVEWNIASKTDGNIKDDDYVQFAEKYFPNLELETGYGIYGRPTNVWKLKKAEIGAFTSIEPTYVYTESVKEKDAYKDLGKAVCDPDGDYEWTAFVDGLEQDKVEFPKSKSDDDYKYTGEGTVTEIYVEDPSNEDQDDGKVTVCEINYYLGQVSKVKNDTITVKPLSKDGKKLDVKTFDVAGYEEDDYVVFTLDYDDDDDYVIGEVIEPETVTGDVKRVELDKKSEKSYLKMDDGEEYDYADKDHNVYDVELLDGKHPDLNTEYTLFLDPNGYVLGFKKGAEEVKYLYVEDSDEHLSSWDAAVIYADATKEDVKVKDAYKVKGADDVDIAWDNADLQHTKTHTNIDEKIWKYTANDKGVVTLTFVNDAVYPEKLYEINNGEAFIDPENASTGTADGLIVDKKTVFVDTMNEKVYTGYDEVPNISNAKIAYVLKKGVVEIMFILDGDIYDKNSTYFILTGDGRETFKHDGDDYWMLKKAYVNGDNEKLNVAYDALKPNTEDKLNLKVGVLYKAVKSVEDDGVTYITKVQEATAKTAGDPVAVGDASFQIKSETTANVEKFTAKDTTFVLVTYQPKDMSAYNKAVKNGVKYTGKWEYVVSNGSIKDMKEDDANITVSVAVIEKDDQNAELVYIYHTYKAPTTKTYALTINGEKVKDYEEGDTFTYTYKATEGKEITAVTGEGFTYTIAADGKSATITGKMTKAGITVTVTEETVVEKVTLTLTGKLVNATVWSTDGKTEYTGTETKEFGVVVSKSFQIPENTTVTIVDSDITAGKMNVALTTEDVTLGDTQEPEKPNTVTLTLDGYTAANIAAMKAWKADGVTPVKINTTPTIDGDVYTIEAEEGTQITLTTTEENVFAAGAIKVNGKVVNNKTAKRLTLTAADGMTIKKSETSTTLIAIHFDEGMTPVVADADKSKIVDTVDNTLYLNARTDVAFKLAEALGTEWAGFETATQVVSSWAPHTAGTTDTGSFSSETWVHAVSKVDLHNATVKYGKTEVANNSYVAVGTKLTVTSDTPNGAVYATRDAANVYFGKAVDSITVDKADIAVCGGYKVVLGAGVKVGTDYKAGDELAVWHNGKLTGLTVDTNVGTCIIAKPATGVSAESVVNANTEIRASQTLVAATKVTVTNVDIYFKSATGVEVLAESDDGDEYVIAGTEITLKGANQMKAVVVKDSSDHVIPVTVRDDDAGLVTLTVGTTDLVVTQP